MKSNKQFTRWEELLKEVKTQKLNSAERIKNNNSVFVPADHKGSRTEPNGSVISSNTENGQELKTRNDEIIEQIQNNIKNLWED